MNRTLRTLIVVPALALALAACATTGGSLAGSAERLEKTSYAFQRNADSDRGGRGYERDARALAEEARDFRQALSDRRADDRDVREAFKDLSRSYHAARDEVERGRDRELARDFSVVTEAYLDVERSMNASDSRDGRRRDRYSSR